jgi:nicotinate phosphoribosyltransferase
MEKNHSQIDVYAVGTNIVTCKKQPALGLVCKLTQINGLSKMKLSSDPEKATFPGKKVVYRVWTQEHPTAAFDLLALEGELIQEGNHTLYDLHGKCEYHIARA